MGLHRGLLALARGAPRMEGSLVVLLGLLPSCVLWESSSQRCTVGHKWYQRSNNGQSRCQSTVPPRLRIDVIVRSGGRKQILVVEISGTSFGG
ncbi:hypothetical protein H4582DRAFT_2019033 [Lactarius indigo]|nr:hypothetical protein H4582DRAFT_2019033 [Lactarius indigo]